MQRTTGRYEVWVDLVDGNWSVIERFRYFEQAKEYAERIIDNLKGGKVQVVDTAENDKVVFEWEDGVIKKTGDPNET